MDVLTISRYVVNRSIEKNKPICNLKLQKLLYYIQANSLIKLQEKCFDENIVNWKYGPVVIEAYQEFKLNGRKKITDRVTRIITLEYNKESKKLTFNESEFNSDIIDDNKKQIIEEVLNAYEDKSATQLVAKTHMEGPWRRSEINDVIDTEAIIKYYEIYKGKILQF